MSSYCAFIKEDGTPCRARSLSGDNFSFSHSQNLRAKDIKKEVEELSGVKFKLKDFRSTLTSITVNEDISRILAMSAQRRHTNVATTQRSYLRIKQGVAGKQLKR